MFGGLAGVAVLSAIALALLPDGSRRPTPPDGGGAIPPATDLERSGTSHGRIGQFADKLASQAARDDAKVSEDILDEMRLYYAASSKEKAVQEIQEFLNKSTDVSLPLEFAIGEKGYLETPPTLRTALIDWLGWIDPVRAAEISRGVLESPTSADEWALALRNVARADATDEAREYLRTKAEQLIRQPDWRAKPSIGYFQAFDVLVHARAVESLPLMSEILQDKTRKDLPHAAFMAVDHLADSTTGPMLERISEDESLHRSRPEMVSQLLARGNLADDAERLIVRKWLLAPERTQQELHAFSHIYPNNNAIFSKNLLTNRMPVAHETLVTNDRRSLQVVEEWMTDPTFSGILPNLKVMHTRLQTFVSSAAASSPASKGHDQDR